MSDRIEIRKEEDWFVVYVNDQEVDAYRFLKPAKEAYDKLKRKLSK